MAKERIHFEVAEVDRVGLVCPRCGTEVVCLMQVAERELPKKCPVCDKDDSAIFDVFRKYWEFFRVAQEEGRAVTLIAPAPNRSS
jgi:DNA replicative helicase MCM subunit Mcm2 (Cdc46/Mcm family)